jgi:hypothetical protein
MTRMTKLNHCSSSADRGIRRARRCRRVDACRAGRAQWCHLGDGVYFAAKRFCAKSRDVVFFVHSVGFHVRIKGEPALYLCVPQQVTAVSSAWRVVADCGPNDNSGPVNRLGFTFKPDDGRMFITFGYPR